MKTFFLFVSSVFAFKFLLFSDLHYSSSISDSDSHSAPNDTSEVLLNSLLKAMSSISPPPDLLISLGDEISHGYKNQFYVKSSISYLFEAYSTTFPLTPKLHTIGNNEGFLNKQSKREYLDYLAFLYQFWVPSSWRNYKFLQNGYYSLTMQNTKFIVLHSNLLLFDSEAAAEQLSWLENELKPLENQTAIILTHSPPCNSMFNTGEQFWTDTNQRVFRRLLKEYKEKVQAVLAGHLHKGLFCSIEGVPVIVNPAVSPVYNTRPSFRVFDLNEEEFDFEEFVLMGESWERSYGFKEVFGPVGEIPDLVKSLTPNSATLDQILALSRGFSLKSSPNMVEIFQVSINSTLPLEVLQKIAWCSLQDLSFEDFTKCKD